MQPVPPRTVPPTKAPAYAKRVLSEYILNVHYQNNLVGQRLVWAESAEQAGNYQKNMIRHDPVFNNGWNAGMFRIEVIGETH